MGKWIKITFTILALALLIYINLPENPYLPSPKISLNLFGLRINKEIKTYYGLDLQGGIELIFEAQTQKLEKQDVKDAVQAARDIIEKRVNFLGVTEPVITVVKSQDKYRIQVALPGITNTEEAIKLIGNTAQLSFREMEISSPEAKPGEATPTANISFSKKTELSGKHIKKAVVQFNPQTGKPEVRLEFTEEGAKFFEKITERNIGKPLAIYIDEFLLSAPVVREKITGGSAVISGDFSVDEAKKLAISINSGALPVPLKLIKQQKIAPFLGKKEVEKSFKAGIIGLASVALFMLLYYRIFGVAAIIALILYGLITLAIFRLIPVVLTLPGLAGFILSIGMAVDSNILISERIKEELRKGKPYHIALNLGFGRALDAIKDANFTTLAVAFILFNPFNWEFLPQFGLIKGFALTLAIGVAVSLFTGVFITKRILKLIKKA